MKFIFYSFIFLFFANCSINETVYWCGDHPCINNKEKEAYFKKTMIVEIKEIKDSNLKNNSEIEKIIEQAKISEKKRIKKEKLLSKEAKQKEKMEIKREKFLAKQAKKDEKKRIKKEKLLAKQAKKDEKKRIKEEKLLAKQIVNEEKKITKKLKKTSTKNIEASTGLINFSLKGDDFKKIVERITKRNAFKSYPDINNLPE